MKLPADTISSMPRLASTISTGSSKRDIAMGAEELVRQQDAKRRPDQDQNFGEPGEIVRDKGAVERRGVTGHCPDIAAAPEAINNRIAPQETAGAVFSPPSAPISRSAIAPRARINSGKRTRRSA